MHRTSTRTARSLLAALAALGGIHTLQAASQTWTGGADSDWLNGANWSGGAAPGALTSLSTDVATFNAALVSGRGGASAPVVIDATRRIGGFSFAAGAGAYVIGSNAGNTLTLGTRGPGYIGASSTVLAAGLTSSQVIAAPITFVQPSSTNGQHGFVNNATDTNVTLTLSGPITLNTVRPVVMVLDGSNTGENTISGNISFTGATQSTPFLIKRGNSTWILSGSNTITGTPATSTNSNFGAQVLDGVLSLQSNTALGSVTQVWVGNKTTSYIQNSSFSTGYTSVTGGTLEVANAITLDNGLTLNLVNAGTLRSDGTNTVNSTVKIAADAAVTTTISTVNVADMFTVGNADNDLTGGALDSVLNIAGPGTVAINNASNYVGNWSVNAGKLQAGNAGALGTGNITLNGGALASSVASVAGVGNFSVSSGSLDLNASDIGSIGLAADKNFTMSDGTWTVSLGSASSSDQILGSGTGTFSIAGTIALNGTIDYVSSYNLLSGFSSGSIGALSIIGYDAVSYQASLSESGVLSFTSNIPEPSAFAALAGLVGLGFAASRRRRAA